MNKIEDKLMLIRCAKLGGEPKVFVFKLDEAKLMHGQKFEQINLTLINRALN